MKNLAWAIGVSVLLGACNTMPEQTKPTAPSACRADTMATLVGKRDLSDDQIKAISGATMVRRALPNQALTMDYRQERVTVLIDVPRKQIIRASCG